MPPHGDIVWATGWEHDATRTLGPMLSIPDFPVVEFTQRPQLGTRLDKLADVRRVAGDRPVTWVDDDLDERTHHWAKTRTAPTLLVQPTPSVGLHPSHVAGLFAFAVATGSSPPGLRQRAGAVMIDDDGLALIERRRARSTYYVLPGGGIDAAAARETHEQTGAQIEIIGHIAHVLHHGDDHSSLQHYLAARMTGGHYGQATGPEYTDPARRRGTYQPVILPLGQLTEHDCRPNVLINQLADPDAINRLLRNPLLAEEPANPPDTSTTARKYSATAAARPTRMSARPDHGDIPPTPQGSNHATAGQVAGVVLAVCGYDRSTIERIALAKRSSSRRSEVPILR